MRRVTGVAPSVQWRSYMLQPRPSAVALALPQRATDPSLWTRPALPRPLLRPPSTRAQWIELMLGLTLVLNLIDAVLTLLFVRAGLAAEANPLMQELLERGPFAFVLGKLLIVSLGATLLWRCRQRTLSFAGALMALVTYGLTFAWHLHGITQI